MKEKYISFYVSGRINFQMQLEELTSNCKSHINSLIQLVGSSPLLLSILLVVKLWVKKLTFTSKKASTKNIFTNFSIQKLYNMGFYHILHILIYFLKQITANNFKNHSIQIIHKLVIISTIQRIRAIYI